MQQTNEDDRKENEVKWVTFEVTTLRSEWTTDFNLELGIFDLAGDCISQLTTHQSLDHSKVKIARDNNASSLSVKSDNIRITTAALTSQRLVRSISIDLEALTLNSSAALITIGLLLPPHQTIQAFEQGKPSCTLSTSAHPTQSDYVVLMDFPLALGVSAKSTNAQMIATLMKRVDQNEIGESWMLKFPGDYLVTEVVNLTNLANLMQRDYEACIPLVRAQNFAGCLSIARLLNQRRKSVERRKDVDAIVNMEWMSNPQPAITRSGGAEEEKLGPKQGLPTSGEGAEGQADDVYVDLPFDRISYILENLTRRQDALDANILDLSHLCSAIKTEVEIYAKENDLLNKVCDKVATFETLLLDLYTHLGKTSQQAKESASRHHCDLQYLDINGLGIELPTLTETEDSAVDRSRAQLYQTDAERAKKKSKFLAKQSKQITPSLGNRVPSGLLAAHTLAY